MDYLVSQLSLYLGGIGLLGLALGWWLGRSAAARHARAALAEVEERREAAQSELERTALETARHAAELEGLNRESVQARERAEHLASELIDSGEALTLEQQKVASFESLLAKRDRKIEELRVELEDARARSRHNDANQRRGQDEFEIMEVELAAAAARISDFEAAAARSRELESEHQTRVRENVRLRTEIERLERLAAESRQSSARIAGSGKELEQLRRSLESAVHERDRLAGERDSAKKEWERVRLEQQTHAMAADAARRELETQRQRVRERDGRLAALEAAVAAHTGLEGEAERLRRELEQRDRQIEELRRRAADAEGARLAAERERERASKEFETLLNAPLVDVDRMATVRRIPVEIRTEDPSPPSPTRGPELLEAPRGAADDLRKIQGIDEAVERTLHSIGVFYYRQVAAWSASDVEWVAAHIGSRPERILRDGWREQATTLAQRTEPREA